MHDLTLGAAIMVALFSGCSGAGLTALTAAGPALSMARSISAHQQDEATRNWCTQKYQLVEAALARQAQVCESNASQVPVVNVHVTAAPKAEGGHGGAGGTGGHGGTGGQGAEAAKTLEQQVAGEVFNVVKGVAGGPAVVDSDFDDHLLTIPAPGEEK